MGRNNPAEAKGKTERQQTILRLIQEHPISRQEVLLEHLRQEGFEATQATIPGTSGSCASSKLPPPTATVMFPATTKASTPRCRADLRRYSTSLCWGWILPDMSCW